MHFFKNLANTCWFFRTFEFMDSTDHFRVHSEVPSATMLAPAQPDIRQKAVTVTTVTM